MSHVSIVGGGIIGLLAARALREAGFDVTVFDRGEIGREASWAGSGILSPLHPWRQPSAIHPLSLWSQRVYPELAAALAEESGIDPQITTSGLLLPDCHDIDVACEWAAQWQVRAERLDAAALRAAEPGLAGYSSALLLPDVAQIRNPRLLRAARVALHCAGVRFEEHCEVLGFATRSARIVAIHTHHGRRPVDRLLIAGGAWSGKLLRASGIDLPITPVRGQILALQTPPGSVRHVLLAEDYYLVPRRDGLVLAGSTVEYVGFDKTVTLAAASALRAAAVRLVPSLADAPQVAHWAGLRPGSADGVPFIGVHPRFENTVVSAGHYRNGITLAPASAAIACALLTSTVPPLDATPYRLDRPLEG